jgi:hypothetical protein
MRVFVLATTMQIELSAKDVLYIRDSLKHFHRAWFEAVTEEVDPVEEKALDEMVNDELRQLGYQVETDPLRLAEVQEQDFRDRMVGLQELHTLLDMFEGLVKVTRAERLGE